jgi:hypothetical protein
MQWLTLDFNASRLSWGTGNQLIAGEFTGND